jgi:DNA helicase-2/ATP-dependent DNA helicase PcrA
MAAEIADTNAVTDDPGPIEEPEWEAPGPAPDPLFKGSGWAEVLRKATADPEWLNAYPDHEAAATVRASQMRLELESLPQPTVAERPVARATSVTGLVTLARCPLQFRWAFVERLPRRPSPALRRGVLFHRSVELHNLGKVPLADLDEIAYDMPSHGRDEAAVTGNDPYDVFLDSRFADQRARFAEVPIDLGFGAVRVRGRIDAVYEPAPGRWEIVDYKSGRPSDDPALDVQLQVYAIAAADGAVAEPVPDEMSVTFAFFGGGEYAQRSIDVDDVWLRAARERVEELSGRFEQDEFEATPSDACHRCDFASFCEAGRAFLKR